MFKHKQKEHGYWVIVMFLCSLAHITAGTDNSGVQLQGKVSGTIMDVLTRRPIPGVTVLINEKSCVTNADGYYSIDKLAGGTYRMEIKAESIVPRSLMIEHKSDTLLDVTVKMSDFNNAMFWASAGERGKIMRWKNPPKWVIYTHVLDSDPPEVFAPQDRYYLFKIIRKELPFISAFFKNPQVELFDGRPNDDPRWTGKKAADGYILCAPTDKGGGYANWKARTGPWVRYAKIRNNYKRAPKVWRHEIAHAIGMAHAFDNERWLPFGDKDPNYRRTKLHDGVEMYTEWDKLWIYCVYSGSRPAGNMPPDCDLDSFIHGKDKLFDDPQSVYDTEKMKAEP